MQERVLLLTVRGRPGTSGVEPALILVQTKIGTQIDPLDILVACELGRGAAAKHGTVVHDVGAVGDAQRLTGRYGR